MGKLAILKEMFSYRRPAGSRTEEMFIKRFIAPLPNAEQDAHGNWHVTVRGKNDPDPRVLFSCHTDTVHYKEGFQEITVKRSGIMGLSSKEKISNCLGADDTAGVFLMREMILDRVPGHYVFHYGEECGCIGSSELAKHNPSFLREFDFAIAFDRQGCNEIITHQSFGRTASDEFAESLAKQLGGFYKPSDRGLYTDTNEYAALIPECTNVGVGYYHAHSSSEILDTQHLFRLLTKLKKLDWTKLVIARDPFNDADDDWHWGTLRTMVQKDKEDRALVLEWDDIYGKARDTRTGNTDSFIEADGWTRRYEGHPPNEENRTSTVESELAREDRDYKYLDPIFQAVQEELRRQLHANRSSSGS